MNRGDNAIEGREAYGGLGDVKRKAGVRKYTERRSDTKPCGLSRTPYRLASSKHILDKYEALSDRLDLSPMTTKTPLVSRRGLVSTLFVFPLLFVYL